MAEQKATPKPKPAEVEDGYSVVVAPFDGAETTVPDSIKQALLDSGYTEK